MKCQICGSKIQETFLNKIVGTYIKEKGSKKMKSFCFECQRKFKTKAMLLQQIK